MNPPTPQVKAAMEGGLGNHPDPEGDRLRDAVVEAGLETATTIHDYSQGGSERHVKACAKLLKATTAYAAHRTKAAPEVVVEAKCEPPEEFRGERWHWLVAHKEQYRPAQFDNHFGWLVFGVGTDWTTRERMTELGWQWHSVASPITITHSPAIPDKRVMPTGDAMRRLLLDSGFESDDDRAIDLVLKALATFPTTPTVDSRIPVTDGSDVVDALRDLVEIIDAAGLYNLANGVQLGQVSWTVKAQDRLNYARIILAKQLNSQDNFILAKQAGGV